MEEKKNNLIQRLSHLYELTLKHHNLKRGYVNDLIYNQITDATDENFLKKIETYIEDSIDNLENMQEQ